MTTLPGPDIFLWLQIQWIGKLFGPAKQARLLMVRPNSDDVGYLGQLADEGKLKPTISLRLAFDQAAEAHRVSEAGHTRGKIVLDV